jgi:hypothetical protein
MPFYVIINENARKFILCGTASRQKSKIVDAVVEKDKNQTEFIWPWSTA